MSEPNSTRNTGTSAGGGMAPEEREQRPDVLHRRSGTGRARCPARRRPPRRSPSRPSTRPRLGRMSSYTVSVRRAGRGPPNHSCAAAATISVGGGKNVAARPPGGQLPDTTRREQQPVAAAGPRAARSRLHGASIIAASRRGVLQRNSRGPVRSRHRVDQVADHAGHHGAGQHHRPCPPTAGWRPSDERRRCPTAPPARNSVTDDHDQRDRRGQPHAGERRTAPRAAAPTDDQHPGLPVPNDRAVSSSSGSISSSA